MRSFATALFAGALLAGAIPAAAQVPGIELRLNPRIGLYVPVTDLGEFTSGTGTTTVRMDNSLAIGLGAELQLAALPFGIRANLDYATGSRVNLESGGVEQEGSEATLLAVVGDLVFRPLPKIVALQPYLFAGGGLKQYDFETETAGSFESESDPTIHLGFGLDFGFGPLALNAELGDYISWFAFTDQESKMQHDLFLTVGFAIGLL
ncbi:MAG TPA: hypothetical protein VMM12_08720 [Longimicrobiales bacterium]|nr:hypothetical protein [Longimicrobiales bacterium]